MSSEKTLKPVSRLRVDLDLMGTLHHVGELAWDAVEKRAAFQFSDDFLQAPLPISPFRLKARPGVISAESRLFEGLHPCFNDSLPDGWGRKLIDRLVSKAGGDRRHLTPIDRLAFVGTTGMGALTFKPHRPLQHPATEAELAIDDLAAQAAQVDEDKDSVDARIDLLAAAAGGSAGARPKILALYDESKDILRPMTWVGDKSDHEAWLIKFRSTLDPKDIGKAEFAYSLMARAAGIDVPEAKLFKTKKGAYFGVRRFDLTDKGRAHVQTASALLGIDQRIGGAVDYIDLLKLTEVLTRHPASLEQMIRRMAFNVFAHNRDDHAKNHAFIMNDKGIWRPTPAYDLTFSSGAGNEHNLAIAGEGRNPRRNDMLRATAEMPIRPARVTEIIDETIEAVQRWPQFADKADLSLSTARQIGVRISI